MSPADSPLERAADHLVDLSGGAAAQRPALVAAAGPAGAHIAALVQPGVEPLQELGVDLAGLHVAEGRQDVEPDQVVIALAGGVPELGDVEPLRDGMPDGDGGLRLLVLVNLPLQLGQEALGVRVDGGGLAQLPPLARERIGAPLDHGAPRARWGVAPGDRELFAHGEA